MIALSSHLLNAAACCTHESQSPPAKAGIEGPGGVHTARQMRLWHTPDEEARILAHRHEYFVDAGWR
jgi:hypothetical protein